MTTSEITNTNNLMRSINMAESLRKKAAKKASGKKRGRPPKNPGERMNVMDAQDALDSIQTATTASIKVTEREKNAFERNFGEGTAFDLDYGKLLIIALCIYIAIQVS